MRRGALRHPGNPDGQVAEVNTRAVEDHVAAHGFVATVDALADGAVQPVQILGARRLLGALATASDDDRAKVAARVKERFEAAFAEDAVEGRIRAATLAFVGFDQPELAERVLRRSIDPSHAVEWSERFAVFAPMVWVRDLALIDQAIEAMTPYDLSHAFDPFTTLLVHGEAALPRIVRVFARAQTKDASFSDEAKTLLLAAMAAAPSEEGFRVLLEQGETRLGVENVTVALAEAPGVVLRSSLPLAVRSPRGGLARDLVELLLRRDPSLAALATTDGQRTLASSVVGEREAAKASELPAVLAAPPWKGRKLPKPIVVEGLSAPDSSPTMAWPEGLRERWRAGSTSFSWYRDPVYRADQALRSLTSSYHGKVPETPEQAVEALGAHIARNTWVFELGGEALPHLAEPFRTAIWNAVHPTAWKIDLPNLRALVAGVEAEAMHGLLVRAGVEEAQGSLLGEARRTNGLAQSLEALLPIASARIAPAAALGLVQRAARKPATAWVLAHPETAAQGLIPLALRKASKERTGAELGLRLLAGAGHEAIVTAAAASHGERAAEGVAQILATDPLALAKAPSLPKWLAVGELAPIALKSGALLPDAAREIVVGMLAASAPDAPYPGLEDVREACTEASLGAFAWTLFRAWWMAGAPGGQAWAFTALGHLADDVAVSRLAPLVGVWPNDGLAARAKAGVEILGTVGSDAALIALHRFSEKAKTKGLKVAAAEKMHEIADARGLTADELADRLTPDLGLDEDGTLGLDVGDRTLYVGFDELLRPFVKDEEGARMTAFPRATKTMDAQKHKDARSLFKQLEKRAQEVAKHVLGRLERAMASGRTWPADIADKCFFSHPLMRHVASHVAWLELDADGAVRAAFRVAEDGTLATPDEEAHHLAEGATIALLHPLRVDADTIAKLSEVFNDYELIQPFPQLGRPTYSLAEDEKGDRLGRWSGKRTPTGRMFSLEKRGWSRTTIGESSKTLPDGRATLRYSPGIDGSPDAWQGEEQTLGDLVLEGTTLEELDPVLASELVYDVEHIFDGA
ncbi:MAG: DUF4132 domain-containing protein [Myxococcales bacterium]|nr:DUF4132 domain-containing protein [Myxococcales bacterium]